MKIKNYKLVKVFADYMSEKRFVSRIYKELL